MDSFLVRVFGPEGVSKVIGELGGWKVRLPERRRSRRQNEVALEEDDADSTASVHDARAFALTMLLIL